jgi:hypothetical protein
VQRLSVDEPLHGLGVAGALHRDGRRRGLDLVQVGGGEFEVGGGEVFLEPGELAGPGDRDDPGLLRQQPRQCDLGRGGLPSPSNAKPNFVAMTTWSRTGARAAPAISKPKPETVRRAA